MISPVRGSATVAAGAPAARRAMHPVDHVVADVHGVGAVGQHVHLEGVAEAGGLEGLVPPAGAFEQRLLHVFRRAGVHPVLDGLRPGSLTAALGSFFSRRWRRTIALHHRFADGHAVIDVAEAAVTRARIVLTRAVIAVGKFDQRVVLAQRHGFGRGSHAGHRAGEQPAAECPASASSTAAGSHRGIAHHDRRRSLGRSGAAAAPAAGLISEGEGDFHLGILGEGLGARQVDRRARAVDAVRAERIAGPLAIAQEEVSGVHQHMAIRFGAHREAPQNRLGEGILHRASLRRVRARRAEGFVALHHQHARSDALERDHLAAALLAAVEADVVGAETRGQARGVQEIGVEAADFEPQRTGAIIPVDGEIAVQLLHAGGAFFDGRNGSAARAASSTAAAGGRLCVERGQN